MPLYQRYIDAGHIRTSLAVPLRQGGDSVWHFLRCIGKKSDHSPKSRSRSCRIRGAGGDRDGECAALTETREALEQQTATAEVLQVINSSPGNLVPVFETILEKAHVLCGAEHGSFVTYDGEQFRLAASHAMPDWFAAKMREGYRPVPGSRQEQLIQGARFVHVPDMTERRHRTIRSTPFRSKRARARC